MVHDSQDSWAEREGKKALADSFLEEQTDLEHVVRGARLTGREESLGGFVP